MASVFPIPSSLQDLERSPYNLHPYPVGFADDDEATRADSFDQLVSLLESGNRMLKNGGMALFETPEGEEGFGEWNDEERIQALYTLVRKSASLALSTRKRVMTALCEAVSSMSNTLTLSATQNGTNSHSTQDDPIISTTTGKIVPQSFRDAFACHLYMLYTIMVFMEAEIKANKALNNTNTVGQSKGRKSIMNPREKERKIESEQMQKMREACANAMLIATSAMASNKFILWKRGVPDENVIGLPCRITYQMIENATGIVARKLASADEAMKMIAITIDSADCMITTIVAALVDMLHSFDHVAKLVSEICCLVSEESKNKLAVEILREIGRLDTSIGTNSDTGGRASGIRNVAPFINELAEKKPKLVMENIGLVLPHLQSEPYNLRSAIVTAIGHILICCKEDNSESDLNENETHSECLQQQQTTSLSERKTALFNILVERSKDVSSYTRVAVLKTWANIIENQSLPLNMLIPVTQLAIDRLQDKTVMVRRSAMQILTLVLENNPFTDTLSPVPYENKLIEVREFILDNLPSNLKNAMDEAIGEIKDGDDESEKEEIKNASINAALSELDGTIESEERDREFVAKAQGYKFLKSAITFIHLFESANAAFQSMLLSSNSSDVTEALRFFVRARHFHLPCAFTGIKQSLSLMWSNEQNIQEEVLSSFVEVFIAVPGTDRKELLPAKQIVDNLIRLVCKATVSELTCIEEAVSRLVKDEIIPADVFLILWSIAAKAPGKPRSAAMMLLSMGASSDPGIVDSASRLHHLLEAGFGDYTEDCRDWATARSAAYALQRITRVKQDPSSAKFIVLEQIVERLCAIVQGDWCDDNNVEDTQAWFGAAEQAIDAIFVVCPAPEQVTRVIIQAMEGSTFGFCHGTPQYSCHSLRLSRFFFVVSHIALKLLVYTEALTGSVRNASAARTVAKQEQADKARTSSQENDEDAIEAELGVAQAAEAETENKMAEIVEKEIVGRGLIGLFAPLLIRIVANESGAYNSEILMQSTTLALCKFMCISSSFCEKHLPLLFTRLSSAPTRDITLRANTIIALGDLAFRFPNEVEPYTPRMYACLRDKSTKVRRHTLMVLTHLILNDMVKVKGQVCEIALCLRDDEVRIRDMARLLFHELSKRSNNPIYNLLPDIVSQLSNMSVKNEDFRNIMSFLLNFIKKDRQNEMLVEKLCQRFPKCTSISQKANISFCVAQLKINEKSIKILNDNFKLYQDALFDDDVFKNFNSIAIKVKKFAKPELKQYVEEWESKLVEFSTLGVEDQRVGEKAKNAKRKVLKTMNRKSNAPESALNSDISDDEDGDASKDIEFEKENMPTNSSTSMTSQIKKKELRSSRRQKLMA
mmetsp:Transcript_22565/g.27674  ORF Transcript_22565/g.27674 Transcript_22565/m.27674 type:complete len:1342 (+) Transcript_22565:71-4096(+)